MFDSPVQIVEYFDGVYRRHDRFWWHQQDRYAKHASSYPYSLLTQMTLRLLEGQRPGRVLDLGAGEGADAIRLALLGYEVDAVEISPVGANKIRAFADEAGVHVNVAVADIANFQPDGRYDVIICNGVLHYVEAKETVVRAMQAATRPGGINVVSLWSSHSSVPDCHRLVPVYVDDERGIVTKLYGDWRPEFLYFEREKAEASHSDMPPHSHSHIKLIARNPEGANS